MAKTYMRAPSGEVFETAHPEYHEECENLGGGSKGFAARQEYARGELRKMIKPGTTVYTVLNSVSASGMSRDISLFIVHKGAIRNINALAADACGRTLGKRGVRAQGYGLDMGFSLVYALGEALWPNGTRRPHGSQNGEPDRSGGYALRHEWLN